MAQRKYVSRWRFEECREKYAHSLIQRRGGSMVDPPYFPHGEPFSTLARLSL
jgi:hypothetical protein